VRFAIGTITCAMLLASVFRSCWVAPTVAGSPSHVCDTSIFPVDVRDQVESRVRQVTGSGQIQSGPFNFCLLLYADSNLQASGNHPSRMTNIPGVGWSGLWIYQGKEISGNITQAHGSLPDGIMPTTGYYRLRPGD
jgi:hypothetical protein